MPHCRADPFLFAHPPTLHEYCEKLEGLHSIGLHVQAGGIDRRRDRVQISRSIESSIARTRTRFNLPYLIRVLDISDAPRSSRGCESKFNHHRITFQRVNV